MRLVRQGHKTSAQQRWVAQGAEALDRSTRLVWRRCTEGRSWNGAGCTGQAAVYLTVHDAIAGTSEVRSASFVRR